MTTGVELATAWVRLVPSMDGLSGEVTKSLSGVDSSFDEAGKKSGSKFSAGAKAAMVAGAAVLAAGIVKVFNTGMEELKFGEKLNAQTDVLVKNTGFSMATDQINDYTLALSKVSGISEEDLQSAGNSLLKFGDMSETTYKRAVDSINDMGAAGKDVAGVGEALGKALADPAKAAGILKKQGVLLNDEQKILIDNFTKTGDKAGAQGVILDALNGTYDGMAEKTGGTLEGNLNKLNNSFENISGDLVASLMPAITAVVDGLTNFTLWIGNNQTTFNILLAALAAIAVAIGVMTVVTWAMNSAFLANPVFWVVLAIIALIAVIVLLVLNWTTVVDVIKNLWGGFIGWITDGLNAFGTWWNGIWEAVGSFIKTKWDEFTKFVAAVFTAFLTGIKIIGDAISAWWNGLWTTVGSFIKTTWDGFIGFVKDTFNNFLTGIKIIGSAITTWWNKLWGDVGTFIGTTWTNITTGVDTAINKVKTVIGTVTSAIGTAWNSMWTGVGSFFSGIWTGILTAVGGIKTTFSDVFGALGGIVGGAFEAVVTGVKRIINSVSTSINAIIDGINGVGSAIGSVVGVSINIPHIPMLAKGGTITGSGSVIVGERGPELLNLPRGASVNPNIPEAGSSGRTYNVIAAPGRTAAQELTDLVNRSGNGGL